MYRIYNSKSDVQFHRVQFQDLESSKDGHKGLFVPRFPGKAEKDNKPENVASKPTRETNKDVSEKNVDIEAIKQEAYTKGKMAGRQEAEKKLHSAVQALGNGLEQIDGLRKSLLESSKEDMIRLITAVAKKVTQTEVEKNKDIIVDTVNKALQSAIEADEYYIRVHPEDLAIVTEKEPLFLASMKGLQHIHFIADQTISKGGCLAESKAGQVDATIESQLSEIYDNLRTLICEKRPKNC